MEESCFLYFSFRFFTTQMGPKWARDFGPVQLTRKTTEADIDVDTDAKTLLLKTKGHKEQSASLELWRENRLW